MSGIDHNVQFGVYRSTEGSFGFVGDRWWRLLDATGGLHVAPAERPMGADYIVPRRRTDNEKRVMDVLSGFAENGEVLPVFVVDDEVFYVTSKGNPYLLAQGRLYLCRPRTMPPGARHSFTFDPAVQTLARLAEDSEGRDLADVDMAGL
jgi:hypothetical protein